MHVGARQGAPSILLLFLTARAAKGRAMPGGLLPDLRKGDVVAGKVIWHGGKDNRLNGKNNNDFGHRV